MSELKLILFYSFVLFFIMGAGTLGATDYLADGYNIEAPSPPPPVADTTEYWNLILDLFIYFVDNVVFFFTLMAVDPFGVGLITTLLFSPLVVALFYVLIKLIRGGG